MLTENVRHILQQNKLLSPDEPLVVGVSGGVDSLALLHLLWTLQVRVHVATLDHGLRADSADDAEFVRAFARSRGLPVTVERVTLAQKSEQAARHARYAFLAEVARQVRATRVAVGHHADDQAETILMRILRGVGLNGLRGMTLAAPLPGAPELTLIRPLLTTRRAVLVAYCAAHDLQPRQDSSNADLRYTRNLIRHQVLPFLTENVNAQVVQALNRLAESAAVDESLLDEVYRVRTAGAVRAEDGKVFVARDAFRGWHPALQRRCVSQAVKALTETVDYAHVLQAVRIGLEGEQGAIAQFPGGVQLRVDYANLVVERPASLPSVSDEQPLLSTGQVVEVNIPGETRIPGANWRLEATLNSRVSEPQAQLSIFMYSKCIVRTRQPGDRFLPLGLGGHSRKVNRWMIDRKIPQALRDRIPLLVIDDEIAAICIEKHWIISEKFAIKKESQRIINLFVYFS